MSLTSSAITLNYDATEDAKTAHWL